MSEGVPVRRGSPFFLDTPNPDDSLFRRRLPSTEWRLADSVISQRQLTAGRAVKAPIEPYVTYEESVARRFLLIELE